MDKKTFDKGVEVRTAVLGKEYVENALKMVDEFSRPFQERVCE
jgi:4-carboxymuconolactone decarboxylase